MIEHGAKIRIGDGHGQILVDDVAGGNGPPVIFGPDDARNSRKLIRLLAIFSAYDQVIEQEVGDVAFGIGEDRVVGGVGV